MEKLNYHLYYKTGFGSYYVSSPGWCFSTEDNNEYINKHYHNFDDDDENIIPDWFYLPSCDGCEKYIAFTNIICSEHISHRPLVTCNYCQNVLERLAQVM